MAGHVLVVDDDVSIRRLLEVALETEGIEVRTARDGREAMISAVDDPPEVVILDVMMPVMDGWETCRRLSANPGTADVPVVFLTARTQDADLQRGRELGAVAYVTKPFDLADLCDLIHDLLAPEPLVS